MASTRNIVVLGASFGGLGAAHYIAKHILPTLKQSKDANYVLHLVDPSSHFWWHIGAPRQIVDVNSLKVEETFIPIMDGFKQYSNLKDSIVFHQGAASALDAEARTVSIKKHEGGEEVLEYYALVIATGIRSPTPLTTLQGDHTISLNALKEINAQLPTAKEIIISGGGPVGVETAGEIATFLKGKGAKITLVSGSDKLLPVLSASRAAKAQKLLEKLDVSVLHNAKVTGNEKTSDGKTQLTLSDGSSMSCDIYIPAFGVQPNTEFLPSNLKSSNGYVKTNNSTLRVDGAGPRVYAAGDVAGADKGGVLNMFNSLPVLGSNIAHDLLGENVAEKKYVFKEAETQIVPVGPKTGVGAFNGFGLPGFMVGFAKGKDYMKSNIPQWTEGKKFVKA